jgi:hypothetical protein
MWRVLVSKITVKINYTYVLSACKAELCFMHGMQFHFVYSKYVYIEFKHLSLSTRKVLQKLCTWDLMWGKRPFLTFIQCDFILAELANITQTGKYFSTTRVHQRVKITRGCFKHQASWHNVKHCWLVLVRCPVRILARTPSNMTIFLLFSSDPPGECQDSTLS